MELQQSGRMPYSGIYGSHYDNPNAGFPGQGRHPLSGGYPFPPMPGQNYTGYPHLGYPSSQSPNPREGKGNQWSVVSNSCVCRQSNYVLFRGALIILPSLHTHTRYFLLVNYFKWRRRYPLPAPRVERFSSAGTGIKATYPKVAFICNYSNFANYPFSRLTLAPVWHAQCSGQPHLWPGGVGGMFQQVFLFKIVAKNSP